MSWMTPSSGCCDIGTPLAGLETRIRPEDLRHPVPAPFHPEQAETELDDTVPDQVVGAVVDELDLKLAPGRVHGQTGRTQQAGEFVGALVHLDRQDAAGRGDIG